DFHVTGVQTCALPICTDLDASVRAIVDGIAGGTSVIVVVRSDFLDDCAAHPQLARLVAEGVHLVGPMAPDALREAIEQPARGAEIGRASCRERVPSAA